MKVFLTYISLFYTLLSFCTPTSWDFEKNGIEMTLEFSQNAISINQEGNINKDLGEYEIGVFLLREDNEICIGHTSYIAEGTIFTVWANPNIDNKKDIYFKLWNNNKECTLDSINAIAINNNKELVYQPNQSIDISTLVFSQYETIDYNNTFCSNALILPTNTPNNTLFSTSNTNIIIDTLTGKIDLKNESQENVTIEIFFSNTEVCFLTNQQTITIHPTLKNSTQTLVTCPQTISLTSSDNILGVQYQWQHNQDEQSNSTFIESIGTYLLEKKYHECIGIDTFIIQHTYLNTNAFEISQSTSCLEKTSIIVDSQNIIPNNTHTTYTFQLNDISSDTGIFERLDNGTYTLTILDEIKNCSYTHSVEITNLCDENKENIIAPYTEDYQSFVIDTEGEIIIYNRSGKCVNTLEGPTEWNGTDQEGNIVPIGLYFIVLPNNTRLSVTILH